MRAGKVRSDGSASMVGQHRHGHGTTHWRKGFDNEEDRGGFRGFARGLRRMGKDQFGRKIDEDGEY